MKDQAEKLRSMAQSLRNKIEKDMVKGLRHTRVIAVTSGKGGVGKTNLSLNLALAMCDLGFKVILLDADMGLANIDIILGLAPRYNLYHVVRREKQIKEIVIEGPKGLKIIPGGSGIMEMANLGESELKQTIAELGKLDGEGQYMIVDTGAGISNNVLSFVVAADEVLVVTTPEPTSLTDAYGIIKAALAKGAQGKMHVVVNRAASEAEGVLVGQKLKSVAERFLGVEISVLGYVLEDETVEEAVMRQEPFYLLASTAPATRNVKEIAAKLCDITNREGYQGPAGLRGFFRSLANFWRS